jgi:hypothetical protein
MLVCNTGQRSELLIRRSLVRVQVGEPEFVVSQEPSPNPVGFLRFKARLFAHSGPR